VNDGNTSTIGPKSVDKEALGTEASLKDTSLSIEKKSASPSSPSCFLWLFSPCAYICSCSSSHEDSSNQQASEDGMFYCSLCEVEVCRSTFTENSIPHESCMTVVEVHFVICFGYGQIVLPKS
jgi:hypothetical protein